MKFAVEYAREATPHELVLPHFFNARGQASEHSIEGMWRTLIVWLLDSIPEPAVQQLSSPYRSYPSKEWDVPELERLLKKTVGKITDQPITFYVDALDECNVQDVDRMLWTFCDIVRKAHESGQWIRVCLASRPYPAITFMKAIFLDFHCQDEHLADINQYVKDRLQIGKSRIAVTIQRDIRRKANGIFMWVVLVVELLNTDFRNGNIYNLPDRLEEIPGDLRSLFVYTLERYQEDRPAMLVCFRLLLFGSWLYDIYDVWWMMQLGLGRPDQEIVREFEVLDDDAMERQIISKTKGFVDFKFETCQFVHESIREFILKETNLFGAEHPSKFEATSHELLRDWWSAEVFSCQPIVQELSVPRGYEWIPANGLELEPLKKRPLGQDAAEAAVYHAEQAHECGGDTAVWLNKFSQTTEAYVVRGDDGMCYMVYGLMSLLLHTGCETLIRDTQLGPTHRGRCDGLALGFRDIRYDHLCPALQAQHLNHRTKFSEGLIHIYLGLEPRSSRLQRLMQEEASDLSLERHSPFYPVPLLGLAARNERLATFFLLALTPPSALEPHLDKLERMSWEDDSTHLSRVLHLIVEQELPTDAIDCMSPTLLEWTEFEIEEECGEDDPSLTTRTAALAQMAIILRSRGVQLPE
jgi:hypothetical protein